MQREKIVLEKLISLWNLGSEQRRRSQRDYSQDTSIKAEVIYRSLLDDFSAEQIQAEVEAFLSDMIRIHEDGNVPAQREVFLCGCCIALIADGLRLSASVVLGVTRSFPVSIWFRGISRIIPQYFSKCQLLDGLSAGLATRSSEYILINCLEGIHRYADFASKDSDVRPTQTVVERIRQRVVGLSDDRRKDVRDQAGRVLSYIGV